MQRIAPWLAFVIAATVLVVGIIELDNRTNEEQIAIPSVQPATTTAPPAAGPTLSPRRPTATPRETVAPRLTPSPTPIATSPPVPLDRSRGPTPHTGGGAVGNGLLVACVAIAARVWLNARAAGRTAHPRLDSNQRPSA